MGETAERVSKTSSSQRRPGRTAADMGRVVALALVLTLVAATVGCGESEPSGSRDRAASLGVVSDEAQSAEPAETPDPAEQAREEAMALAESDDFAAAARTLA